MLLWVQWYFCILLLVCLWNFVHLYNVFLCRSSGGDRQSSERICSEAESNGLLQILRKRCCPTWNTGSYLKESSAESCVMLSDISYVSIEIILVVMNVMTMLFLSMLWALYIIQSLNFGCKWRHCREHSRCTKAGVKMQRLLNKRNRCCGFFVLLLSMA